MEALARTQAAAQRDVLALYEGIVARWGDHPEYAARLRSVEPSGPAATAGLKAGDVIAKLDNHVLEDGTDLIALVRKYAPGTVVPVEYRRGSKTSTASVTLVADSN